MKDIIGTYIINNIFFWIVVIGVLFLIIFFKEIKNNSIKKSTLKRLSKNKYMVLNDVVVSSTKKSHKIDNVIISKFGIFVIKYVDQTGKIYGDERELQWIALKDRKKTYFDNPLREVHSSIRVLSELLDLNEKYFIPIVCFTEEVTVSCDTKDKITQIEFLDDVIKTFKKEIIIYGLKEIRAKIKNSTIVERSTGEKEETKSNTCPKCGGKLVVRKGKYGDFVGCNNYPNCKFTREL